MPQDVPDTEAASAAASYGERYARRLPLVLLAVGLLTLLSALLLLARDSILPTSTVGVRIGVGVGALVSVLLGGAFWTALIALVPGSAGRGRAHGTWWALAVVVAVGAGAMSAYGVTRAPDIAALTISGPEEGCHAFLDTIDTVASKQLSNAQSVPYLITLQDAARANDPDLANDLDHLIAYGSDADYEAGASAILTRCVTYDYLTTAEVDAWIDKITSY